MRRVAILVRSAGLWLVGIAVVVGASGWLYLLRPFTIGLPGSRVRSALPLDDIAGRGGVSLVEFVVVWAAGAALLGLLARTAALERLVAALALAVGLGAWLYGTQAFATFLSSGVSLHEALHTAAKARVVYLPAALAGGAGAILGRRRAKPRPWAPVTVAVGVALAGIIDILSAVTPEITERLFRVERFVPSAVPRVASAGVAAAGVVLLLVARGLARRKRRAWQIAACLLAVSSLLHLVKGLDYEEATITWLLALVLIARRHDFDAPGDVTTRSVVLVRAVAILGAIYAYGAVALLINAGKADQPYSLGFAFSETTRALLGGGFGASHHVHGRFGTWFPFSVALLAMVGVGVIVVSWLSPWRYRLGENTDSRRVARPLVHEWGTDTLSPFALRSDKSVFLSEDDRAFVAYTVVAGIALVGGDPVGPPDAVADVLERFLGFAHTRGWKIALLGASERWLGLAEEFGLHAMYWGDEAVIDTATFSLEGRAIRKVRQSVHRLERAGYVSVVRSAGEIEARDIREFEAIAREWRGDRPKHGFAMELDGLFRLGGDDELFVIGRDPQGEPRGFLHFAVAGAGSALSLSSMPRLSTTPNGFNEWLTCEAIAWAREHGFAKVSLNFAAFGALFDPDVEVSGLRRLERDALLLVRSPLQLQLDNLLRFTKKFLPSWQRRYVLYERGGDLPRIVVAALTAEGYLPGAARRAG